ncbi:MAG: exonuclease SbcCD subunit D [Eubacteriales bacterium]|nr:exonuclease SbcCD subunit D [Eubacteriales bacterium]
MKFMHLSDLHIGKRVNEFSMLEDQKYILNQILSILDRTHVDGVILAGDIYDKPIPPAEAVQVFDAFLTELADRGVCVFAVSGNHDSAERLAFGSRLMDSRAVYFSPVYDGNVRCISLKDAYGSLCVHLLPFVKPAAVRRIYADEPIETYQDAVRSAVSHMKIDSSVRNLLIAHQFVTGAARCDSEEVLVGGLDNVDASVFDAFDYVALGHIHSPQHVGRETIRYSGTPLKYSFSEAGQEKSVTIVECRQKGSMVLMEIPLKPLRDLRKIRGTYQEVTDLSHCPENAREDYVHITLTDEEDVIDGLSKLRVIYPNLMRLEYDNRRTRENRDITLTEEIERKSELELFQEFYELQNNQPMTGKQEAYMAHLIEERKEECM